ncbi:MAG: ATP-grasp fold amidoligase family protein [Gemmatimonadota bacterium]|nr:ATP-grasp fold amidoligase family protein [Gemmatimonadota bacterium]
MFIRVTGRLRRGLLSLMVRLKWEYDRRHLPLTPDHYELYGNIHRMSWQRLRSFPHLVCPATRNDALNWIKLFDQWLDSIVCCDELRVRDCIRARVGEAFLVTLYQAHERFAEIDFEALPSAFVIKTNHDAGTALIVRDKQRFDRAAAEAWVDKALRRPYRMDAWRVGVLIRPAAGVRGGVARS